MFNRNRHPRPRKLLEACLGELPDAEAARLERHLEDCPGCRAEMEAVRAAHADFREYYQRDYKAVVPPPPRNWETFHARLQERQAQPRPRLVRRLSWAAATAALVFAAVLGIQRMRVPPVVSAEEVLNRAVAAEQRSFAAAGDAAVRQRLRIQVGTHTLTRTVYRHVARQQHVDRWSDQDSALQPALAAELSGGFRQARLDWADPLSPASLGPWLRLRASQPGASESVERQGSILRVTSVSPSEPLRETEISVRETDYHPVEARLHFQDGGQVEVAELAYEIMRMEALESSVRAELLGLPAAAAKLPEARLAPAPAGAAEDLDNLELEVRYALHRHQADLGRDLRVERSLDGSITVKGLVASAGRRTELQGALSRFPRLKVEIETAEEAARRQTGPVSAATEPSEPAPRRPAVLEQALRDGLPDQQARDAFVLAALEYSQQALTRGFALERLAQRYPAAEISRLSPDSRARLRTMIAEHEQALRSQLQSLFQALEKYAAPSNRPTQIASEKKAWQEVSRELLPELQTLNRLVVELVTGAESGPADQGSPLQDYVECSNKIQRSLDRFLVE